jgi:hypothetical protein
LSNSRLPGIANYRLPVFTQWKDADLECFHHETSAELTVVDNAEIGTQNLSRSGKGSN